MEDKKSFIDFCLHLRGSCPAAPRALRGAAPARLSPLAAAQQQAASSLAGVAQETASGWKLISTGKRLSLHLLRYLTVCWLACYLGFVRGTPGHMPLFGRFRSFPLKHWLVLMHKTPHNIMCKSASITYSFTTRLSKSNQRCVSCFRWRTGANTGTTTVPTADACA